MLLCAAEGNRLQLRRFTNEPGAANPAAVAMRPLGATPLALTRHCKTDSVAVLLDDNSLKILSDRSFASLRIPWYYLTCASNRQTVVLTACGL